MGLDDVLGLEGILNNTNASALDFLPADIVSQIGSLITILKITGVVVIGYIVFLLIKYVFGIKRHRKISKIYKKVEEMDRKLDALLGKKEVKKVEKSVEKKEGLISKLFKKKDKKENKIKDKKK